MTSQERREWVQKAIMILRETPNPKNKVKFITTIIRQALENSCEYLPSDSQIDILRPMWLAREKRRIEKFNAEYEKTKSEILG
jgi:hypothetical protein